MRTYKVGDLVRLKTYKELARVWGADVRDGEYIGPYKVSTIYSQFGHVFRICGLNPNPSVWSNREPLYVRLEDTNLMPQHPGVSDQWFWIDMIEPIEPLSVTADGFRKLDWSEAFFEPQTK